MQGLIDKIDALKYKQRYAVDNVAQANINGYNTAIDLCLTLIRQHQAALTITPEKE